MTPDQFAKELANKVDEVKKAIEKDIPLIVESVALRYVDDNFRNQGYEGDRWKDSNGTILVKSGTLRRGFEGEATANQVKITNDVPYAAAHNEGFNGEVSVPEHQRAVFVKKGAKKTKTGKVKVKAYKKKLKLPQRQMAPITSNDSPTLSKNINEAISNKINSILTK